MIDSCIFVCKIWDFHFLWLFQISGDILVMLVIKIYTHVSYFRSKSIGSKSMLNWPNSQIFTIFVSIIAFNKMLAKGNCRVKGVFTGASLANILSHSPQNTMRQNESTAPGPIFAQCSSNFSPQQPDKAKTRMKGPASPLIMRHSIWERVRSPRKYPIRVAFSEARAIRVGRRRSTLCAINIKKVDTES